ncbi:MAG: transposase [Cyanobacteria bacterium]|nr:transposase [Cyanobacteriota bacterium]
MLLLYAYSVGIPSSRKIERACYEDAGFRVLSGNQQPDHSLPGVNYVGGRVDSCKLLPI